MDMRAKRVALVALVCAAPAALDAQFDFKLAGRPVQVHSFATHSGAGVSPHLGVRYRHHHAVLR